MSSTTSAWGPRKGRSDTMPSAVRFLLLLGDPGDAPTTTPREEALGRADDDNNEQEAGDKEPSRESEEGPAHRALL